MITYACIAQSHESFFTYVNYHVHTDANTLTSTMGPVRIRHSSHDFGWQSSHSVDLAGWQAKMASIEIWIP